MPVPCPQVAEYVWHRRGLLALNLSRVDFLLGESLHPRVPWHQRLGGTSVLSWGAGAAAVASYPPKSAAASKGCWYPVRHAGRPQ